MNDEFSVGLRINLCCSESEPYPQLGMMPSKTSQTGANRTPRESLEIRKAKRAEEAVSAMAEYEKNQRAMLERTAKLRAERLAQQAGSVEKMLERKADS
jgi:hypothetical protein